jgi:hypothetical protein
VEDSLQQAESLPKMADRAFALRAVLDRIRDDYREPAGPPKKPLEVIPQPKKIENPPDIKKDPPKDDGKKASSVEASSVFHLRRIESPFLKVMAATLPGPALARNHAASCSL